MSALHLVTGWPVDHVAAAIVRLDPVRRETVETVDSIGDAERVYRLASLSKPITAWAIMVAVEEGTLDRRSVCRLAGHTSVVGCGRGVVL